MPSRAVLVSLAVLTAAWASADTLRVPADHSTIQEALDAAADGDTIAVAQGTHAPFVVSGRSGLRILGKGKPVVDGQGVEIPVVVQDSEDVTVDGFVLQNSSQYGARILGAAGITLRRCRIHDVPDDGLELRDATGILVEKNRFEDIGEDGIDLEDGSDDATEVTDSRIAQNRFENLEAGAILIEGRGIVAEKNRIADVEVGIAIDNDEASGNTVAKNRIELAEVAIYVEGTGNVVERNKLRRTRDAGIGIRADGTRVEKNRIDEAGDEGIDLEGSDNHILGNRVKRSGGNGMEIGNFNDSPGGSTGNLVERNTVIAAGGNGFYVDDDGNVFRRNTAKKSADADLLDERAPGSNVYEDNKFGTEVFD